MFGLEPGLLEAQPGGELNQQCYGSSLASAMAGIGAIAKKFRKLAKQTFVASAPAAQGAPFPGLSGSADLLARFAAGLSFPGGRTPQQALYDFRAPVAVLECSIRGDTSRPPSEEGANLLKAAIRDARHGVATMLFNLPDMDPNQLADDMGNTLLTAAISSSNHSLTLMLLRQPGINIRRANAAGQTPIALALQGFYHPGDRLMQDRALVELLNTYHSQGHSYDVMVTEDLAQLDDLAMDDNMAWCLSGQGIIQNCRFFQGPLCQLQIEQLNRLFTDCYIPKPAIHTAAEYGHIDTVVFLLSLRNVGLDLHALVSYGTGTVCTSQIPVAT